MAFLQVLSFLLEVLEDLQVSYYHFILYCLHIYIECLATPGSRFSPSGGEAASKFLYASYMHAYKSSIDYTTF